MSDEHEDGEEEGGPTAAFSLVRYENPQIVQLEVRFSYEMIFIIVVL